MAEIITDGDLPPVNSDTLKQDHISFEEAVAAQLAELDEGFGEQPAPEPDPGQSDSDPGPEVAEEGPSSEEDTPVEEVGEPDQEEFEPEYLFEVDGEQITLEEAKNGYLRRDKFTQRTQELAEERRKYEDLTTQAMNERELYIQGLETAKQLETALFQEPDWATLQQQDPQGYVNARQTWDQIQQRRQNYETGITQAREAQNRDLQTRINSHWETEAEKLLDVVPEWREAKAAQEFYDGLNEYLTEYEFTPEEIGSISDHRQLLILRDAMRGRGLNNSAPLAKKKVAKARKGLAGKARQPLPNPQDARLAQSRERVNSGNASLDDAIEMQMNEIGLDYTDEMK